MSPASTTVWILLMTAALALSGCSDTGPAEVAQEHDDHVHADPVPAAGGTATQVRIPAGASEGETAPWFHVDGPIEAPTTLRIVNEDDAVHRVVGEFRDAAFGPGATADHGDGHAEAAGDDHAGGHGGGHEEGHADGHAGHGDDHVHEALAFDVTVEPGQSVEMDVEEAKDIAVHCHPHPWMVDTWEVLSATNTTFDVTVNTLNLTTSRSGDVRMGHDGDDVARLNVSLEAPDLMSFTATLRWDDAADDGPLGGDFNEPDAFLLRLIGPDGAVAAEDTLEARAGTLVVAFTPDVAAWPETVDGRGASDAMRTLMQQRPPETHWSGVWTVEVWLQHAPGYLPADVEDGGSGHDAPEGYGFDGHQVYDLDMSAVHAWPSLGGPVEEVEDALATEDGHAAHEH